MKPGKGGENALRKGIVLFNAGQFFAAHEVWEDWWRATTRPERRTIQGIIQIAVAMHHFSTGNRTGAISVMERALRNLDAETEIIWHGVNLPELRRHARSALEQMRSGQVVAGFSIATE